MDKLEERSAYQTEDDGEDFLKVYEPGVNEKIKMDLFQKSLDDKGISTMQGTVLSSGEDERDRKDELGAKSGWLTK